MSEVIRIVCPHGPVQTFFRDQGIWTTTITGQQTARDSETGEFIEYRYPVRCEPCGRPGHPIVADANQGALNEALNFIDREGIEPVTLTLWAGVLGRLDRMRHA